MTLTLGWQEDPSGSVAPSEPATETVMRTPWGGVTSTLTLLLLATLGVPDAAISAAADEANRRDDHDDAASLLMASGYLDPAQWWPALAGALGLAYRERIEPVTLTGPVQIDGRLDRSEQHIWITGGPAPMMALAPRGVATARISSFLAAHPTSRRRIVVTSAEVLRDGLRWQAQAAMTEVALTQLARSRPIFSASRPPAPRAVRLAGGVLAATPLAIGLAGAGAAVALAGVFLPLTLLRIAAAQTTAAAAPPLLTEAALPRYGVLVPLYHEAAIVPQLAEALAALDYPRDKLDVKLLVEADDRPTRIAAQAFAAYAGWDVLAVPPSTPRTKPKALAFGLQLVDAEFVTVFDAEDRPAPDQLRRAAAAFARAPANVACLQAALRVESPGGLNAGWLAGQFALEYRVLFDGLLPWLAERTGFFLLGGTSNHFRRDALLAVGSWDPYNVTEDADIAVRLYRAGWRLGVLASETREEAPVRGRIWMAQRTRWLKGWMQTWLVHMRRPRQLLRELGLGGFLLFQLLLGGQILSAFLFPASVIAALLLLSGVRPLLDNRSFLGDVGLLASLATGVLAWGATAWLAWRATPPRRRFWTVLQAISLPFYWLLLYPAAIRAYLELAATPFRWNKTPHGNARGPTPHATGEIGPEGSAGP